MQVGGDKCEKCQHKIVCALLGEKQSLEERVRELVGEPPEEQPFSVYVCCKHFCLDKEVPR